MSLSRPLPSSPHDLPVTSTIQRLTVSLSQPSSFGPHALPQSKTHCVTELALALKPPRPPNEWPPTIQDSLCHRAGPCPQAPKTSQWMTSHNPRLTRSLDYPYPQAPMTTQWMTSHNPRLTRSLDDPYPQAPMTTQWMTSHNPRLTVSLSRASLSGLLGLSSSWISLRTADSSGSTVSCMRGAAQNKHKRSKSTDFHWAETQDRGTECPAGFSWDIGALGLFPTDNPPCPTLPLFISLLLLNTHLKKHPSFKTMFSWHGWQGAMWGRRWGGFCTLEKIVKHPQSSECTTYTLN